MGGRIAVDAQFQESAVAADANLTSLCLRINGRSIVICNSDNLGHAEHYLCQFILGYLNEQLGDWDELIQSYCKSHPSNKDKTVFDVFLTRSLCQACTDLLLALVGRFDDKMRLRLFCATIYRGENNRQSIADIQRLRSNARVRIYGWPVREMAQAHDSDSVTVLQVAFGGSMTNANAENSRQWHKLDSRLMGDNLAALPYKVGSFYSLDH